MAQAVRDAFGDKSLYDILGVAPDATPSQLKRAYFKRARKWHPDKNGGSEAATAKFQALGIVHSVLKDPERREAYDATGEFEDEVAASSADNAVWQDYWRALFPKVDMAKIDEFTKKYRKSDEERSDVLKAYTKHEGDMDAVLGEIMCCSDSDEDRFAGMIEAAVSAGEVDAFPAFTKSRTQKARNSAAASKKRKRAAAKKKREAKEAEEMLREIVGRGAGRSKRGGGAGAGGGAPTDLVALIQGRQRMRQADNFADALAAKYGGAGADDSLAWGDTDEEEDGAAPRSRGRQGKASDAKKRRKGRRSAEKQSRSNKTKGASGKRGAR